MLLVLNLLFFLVGIIQAKPLGTIPVVEQGEARLELELLSDLWASPYHLKDTPQKINQVAVKFPIFNASGLKMSFAIESESRSLGVPDLTVGNNQVFIGPQLRSQSFGFAMGKTNIDDSSYSLFISRESASDEAFNHSRDIWFSSSAFYRSAPQNMWSWMVGYHYSNNRGIWNGQIIPLLGFVRQMNTAFKITAGFPFIALEWADGGKINASLTATSVGLLGRASFSIDDDLLVLIRGGITNRSYAHIARIADNNRLFFEEKVIDIGFKLKLNHYTSYGLMVGYSMDRKIFEGETVFSPIGPVRTVQADFFGGIRMEYIF